MPIYEYCCRKCGKEFEALVFRDDNPECPACGAGDPEKKMSSFGFSVGGTVKTSGGSGSSCGGCTSSNCSGCS